MPTKNKIKLNKNATRLFSGTEVGVLIEDLTFQIQIVAEGVSGLNDKTDSLSAKVDNLEVKVDNLEVKMDKIQSDTEIIKMDMETIKHDLKNKISRDEFAILERRVALLESRR